MLQIQPREMDVTMPAKDLQRQQAIQKAWNDFAEDVSRTLKRVPVAGRREFLVPINTIDGSEAKDSPLLKKIMEDVRELHWNAECVLMERRHWLVCVPQEKKPHKK